jgi:esterase/lipase
VILVHGFTGTIDGPGGTSWIKLSKKLAKNGFDVFRFNFRFTSSDYKDFHKMTIASEVSDLKFILKQFSKKYNKIGVVGESFAGVIIPLAFGSAIKCLALWYPMIDYNNTELQRMFESVSGVAELKKSGYIKTLKSSTGDFIKVGKIFVDAIKKINLHKNLRKIACPVLIVMATKDTLVPNPQSVNFLKLVKSEKKKLYKVNSDHGWFKRDIMKRDWAAESFAIKETVKWIKSNI